MSALIAAAPAAVALALAELPGVLGKTDTRKAICTYPGVCRRCRRE